jgi:hypothetical protein
LALLARVALLVLLIFWTWRFAANPLDQSVIGASFMHVIDLVFHEAGHVLFAPFGRFMTTIGGSLMQVIVPAACGASEWVQSQFRIESEPTLNWFGTDAEPELSVSGIC